MNYLKWKEPYLNLIFAYEKGKEVTLLYAGMNDREPDTDYKGCRIVDVLTPGLPNYSFRGAKNYYDTGQLPLSYQSHEILDRDGGKEIRFVQKYQDLTVTTTFTLYEGIPVFRCSSGITNHGTRSLTLEGISSLQYGFPIGKNHENEVDQLLLYEPHNTWSEECRWVTRSLRRAGLEAYGNLSYDRIHISNSSGLSSGEHLPMGGLMLAGGKESAVWQIESNGAWAWEAGIAAQDYRGALLENPCMNTFYLQLSGPRLEENHWRIRLNPGESFQSVPAAMAFGTQSVEEALAHLTNYRRRIRRPHIDYERLPVIYNDYMNGFMGDSTAKRLFPLIEQAADAGCEVFVIDCGWYDAGDWQYTFGEFKPSKERFPNGLEEVVQKIRQYHMIPGIWLELEAFGIDCPLADQLPKDWLFERDGNAVIDSGRYQLDFRNEQVRKRAADIIRDMVETYGFGYIKLDYNMCSGPGTDYQAFSLGDGLLRHNRAYLQWLDSVREMYPDLILENCGSGGLRMDYAMLSRMSIQSCSDQEDSRKMAVIAANSASAVTPEQCGIWSYPGKDSDAEDTVFNMINSMLFRVHMGGRLDQLAPACRRLAAEAVTCYKGYRKEITGAVPRWPLGLHRWDAPWLCFCLEGAKAYYIAVWRLNVTEKEAVIPLDFVEDRTKAPEIRYPSFAEDTVKWDPAAKELGITLERPYSARFLTMEK